MKPTQHFAVNFEFVRTSILKALGGLLSSLLGPLNHYVFIVDEALVVRETRNFLLDE